VKGGSGRWEAFPEGIKFRGGSFREHFSTRGGIGGGNSESLSPIGGREGKSRFDVDVPGVCYPGGFKNLKGRIGDEGLCLLKKCFRENVTNGKE